MSSETKPETTGGKLANTIKRAFGAGVAADNLDEAFELGEDVGREAVKGFTGDNRAQMRSSNMFNMLLMAVISVVVGLVVLFYIIDVAFSAYDDLQENDNIPDFAEPLVELTLIFGVLALAIIFIVPLVWAVRKAT